MSPGAVLEGSLGVPRAAVCSAGLLLPLHPVLSSAFLSAQADTTHPLTKHRKIASSFRDSSLFDIFTLSCNLLKQVRKPSIPGGCESWQRPLG